MLQLGAGVRRALRLSVTAALAVYIVLVVDLGSVGRTLGRVHPGAVIVALALYVLGQGLSAYKWALVGRSVGLERPLRAYTRFYFIGMFFNLLGPSTVGGDVARGLYLGEGHRPGLALNSVLFDRLSGLALLMALGAAAVLLFPEYGLPLPLTAVLVASGAVLVLGWWTCPRLVRLLPTGNRIRRLVETDLAPFWGDRRLLGRLATIALVFHLSQVCVQFLLARAAGVAVPFSYCLVYHPIISVMAALPVSVAGLGVREGAYIYFLTRIGIDGAVAVTVGLLWFAVSVLAGLLGGVLFLASGAALPPLRGGQAETARAG